MVSKITKGSIANQDLSGQPDAGSDQVCFELATTLDRSHPSKVRHMAASALSYNESGKSWQDKDIDLQNTNLVLDEICYVFLKDEAFYKHQCSDEQRRRILAPFEVPDFLCSQLCTDLNGYFGCRSTFGEEQDEIREYHKLCTISTWARILTKKVLTSKEKAPQHKGYVWYEMAFFIRWSHPSSCRILCIDTPPVMREGLAKVLNTLPPLEFRDPFAMLLPLLDEVLKLCDDNTWRVTKEIRNIEKERTKRPDFEELCNLHRHARHLVEVETVATETMERLVAKQQEIFGALQGPLTETYRHQAIDTLGFQLQIMKSLKWRVQASSERLDGEMNLLYNMLASMDSQVMKSITLLTMIFLPATFICALFSTTFFSFDVKSWKVSNQFWIYWAVVVPLTLVVVFMWWIWLGGSYRSIRSLRSKILRPEAGSV